MWSVDGMLKIPALMLPYRTGRVACPCRHHSQSVRYTSQALSMLKQVVSSLIKRVREVCIYEGYGHPESLSVRWMRRSRLS